MEFEQGMLLIIKKNKTKMYRKEKKIHVLFIVLEKIFHKVKWDKFHSFPHKICVIPYKRFVFNHMERVELYGEL